jgi:hypothetical protein
VLGFRARKKPLILPLAAATRQQRDMLLVALVAFSRAGWLEAALAGNTLPIPYASFAQQAIEAASGAGALVQATAEESSSTGTPTGRRSLLMAAGGAFSRSTTATPK